MFPRAWMHRGMWFWPKNATKEIWFARLTFYFDNSSGSRTIQKKKKKKKKKKKNCYEEKCAFYISAFK